MIYYWFPIFLVTFCNLLIPRLLEYFIFWFFIKPLKIHQPVCYCLVYGNVIQHVIKWKSSSGNKITFVNILYLHIFWSQSYYDYTKLKSKCYIFIHMQNKNVLLVMSTESFRLALVFYQYMKYVIEKWNFMEIESDTPCVSTINLCQ